LAAGACCSVAFAQGEAAGPGLLGPGHWRVVVSPYTIHWRPSDEHRRVVAIGAERQRSDDWLAGGSYFRNSFGQPSAYLYVGKRYPGVWAEQPQLFLQWSAGLMYGYRGKFEDKVPFNNNGFSPGALASVGWAFDQHKAFTVHLLGDAGAMFQFSMDLK
jgi:hypothetical protein